MGDVAEVRMLGANIAKERNRSHCINILWWRVVHSEEAMMDSTVILPAQTHGWSALYLTLEMCIQRAKMGVRASCKTGMKKWQWDVRVLLLM